MDYVAIFNELKEKQEEFFEIKENLIKILEKLTKSDIQRVALEAGGMLKLAKEIESPYNRYLHKITKPKELIQIHKIYDATIDLIIENTDIFKDHFK